MTPLKSEWSEEEIRSMFDVIPGFPEGILVFPIPGGYGVALNHVFIASIPPEGIDFSKYTKDETILAVSKFVDKKKIIDNLQNIKFNLY